MVCSLRDPPASLRGQFQVGPPARVSEESGGGCTVRLAGSALSHLAVSRLPGVDVADAAVLHLEGRSDGRRGGGTFALLCGMWPLHL